MKLPTKQQIKWKIIKFLGSLIEKIDPEKCVITPFEKYALFIWDIEKHPNGENYTVTASFFHHLKGEIGERYKMTIGAGRLLGQEGTIEYFLNWKKQETEKDKVERNAKTF